MDVFLTDYRLNSRGAIWKGGKSCWLFSLFRWVESEYFRTSCKVSDLRLGVRHLTLQIGTLRRVLSQKGGKGFSCVR